MIRLRNQSIICFILVLLTNTLDNAQTVPRTRADSASVSSLSSSVAKGDTLVHRVTIKGIITNVEVSRGGEFPVIFDDSYLQLVLYSEGAGIPVSSDSIGRMASPSSLPKTAISKKGPFSIACKDLKLGTYIVAVQAASLRPQHLAVLQKDGAALQIEVSKNTRPLIDVGDVTIPINR